MDMSGFRAFDFSEGTPFLSVTQHGITFNKSVTLKLGMPEYVLLLINPEARQVALQACSPNTPRAVRFFKARNKGIMSVRWNSHDLIDTFARLLGVDLEMQGFRVKGVQMDKDTMLFDLNTAKMLV